VNGPAERIGAIRLQPVGEGVALTFADEVAAALARVFHVSCHVETTPLDPFFAWDSRRRQYYSTAILERLSQTAPAASGDRWLALADVDLFVPVLTFVFGEAQLPGRYAVVSTHRLREEFYGLPANSALLLERAVKEAVHELGHTVGLRHCSEWSCVMASTHAVERLDVKSAEFCSRCRRAVDADSLVAGELS
jgi:archaemetzincin